MSDLDEYGVALRIAAALEELGAEFVVDEDDLREAVRLRRTDQIYFLPLVLKIDLFMRGTAPLDRSEFDRRVRVRVGETASLYAATPEDSLLRKLAGLREGGDVSDRQWRDVLGIIRISGPRLDHEYLHRWAGQLGVSDLLHRALNQAQGSSATGRPPDE